MPLLCSGRMISTMAETWGSLSSRMDRLGPGEGGACFVVFLLLSVLLFVAFVTNIQIQFTY